MKTPGANNSIETLNNEQKKALLELAGWAFGKVSKVMLEMAGHEVNYKINGESIDDISALMASDIKKRIEIALSEERYEDAAKLSQILQIKKDGKKNNK